MKKQDEKFLLRRKQLRHFLVIRRLGVKNQTYHKMMGQKVNGEKNGDLMDWEVEDIEKGLDEVEKTIKEFRDELAK